METTIVVYLIWCILGLYRNNGKEQGNYYRYVDIYIYIYTHIYAQLHRLCREM